MRADTYAGPPRSVARDGVIRNATVTRSNKQTTFSFTVTMAVAYNESDLYWYGTSLFGFMRVMWAIGDVSDDSCSAPVEYHGAARGLAHLNFPMGRYGCSNEI